MTYFLTQPLGTAVKVGGWVYTIQFTLYTVIGTGKNAFIIAEPYFKRKEHNLLYQTIVQNLINLVLLMKKCYVEWSTLRVYSMNQSLDSTHGRQGMEKEKTTAEGTIWQTTL